MYQILEGEVIEQLKTMADASVDSIVTDPPYGLEFMGKDWDAPWKTDHRQGFDGTMQIPDSPFGRSKVRNGNGASYGADAHVMQSLQNWHFAWASEALRVLKPGGYLLAFGGSRTYHRLACAVEDAGFEIRDQIMWIYGSGFPKSLDVSKAIDKMTGAKRAEGSEGKYTSRRPREAVSARSTYSDSVGDYKSSLITMPVTDMAQQWSGWGTALKPSHEPVVVARKPLIGTVAANVLKYETGALNIDACRVGAFVNTTPSGVDRRNQTLADMGYRPNTYQVGRSELSGAVGRWPANVIHDGSDEVLAAFPDAPGQLRASDDGQRTQQNVYGKYGTNGYGWEPRRDTGSAARFFYCAKASRSERNIGQEGLFCVELESYQKSGEGKWECVGQKALLRVDTANLQLKVIAVSGTQNSTASEWNTMLFGKENAVPFHQDTMSITKTTTNLTTIQRILSCFQNLSTSDATLAVKYEMENGGNLADDVENGIACLPITYGKMASALGVENAALPMLLRISVKGAHCDHPTVKPIALMAYLCRLVTPPQGTVLDLFMGSGSTGIAALREKFNFIGIEVNPEYVEIARRRIESDAPLFNKEG
jgi:site-specific DNA-methyltransferase (adenine-specific)